ncbi:hypothetical protein ACOMICROBIO_FLGHMIGD_03991 [Vibrio sp. B1FLJ16]|uniref:hypothetical protein n=1 Tax=Vibrio sp. B1FLJ16 TaxID=2751178 RepID=UPI0015F64AC6|nr:hypothetical protein [Vibrio sp. B1FLJ16]CAD7819658.1 hypothetical protein ACOMICROBIO_FLGHMIGD_03991 [Vibrio sp. B1FLJ16]CAE6939937.1 hypothetical protein ACOMICROBIO_FLGHMIGD_03991 [Vibrio sp. B1FLJ16]
MRVKDISLKKWKSFTCLTLFYLVVSLITGAYLTQFFYEQYLDGDLRSARSQIWLDGAESGEQKQTQLIFRLKSQRLLEKINWQNPIQIFNFCQIKELSQKNTPLSLTYKFSLDLSSNQSGDLVEVGCQLQSRTWLASSILFSALSMLLFSLQPRPLNHDDLNLLKHLRATKQVRQWKQAIHQFRAIKSGDKINQDFLFRLLETRTENLRSIEDKVALLEKASKPLTLSFTLNNGNVDVAVNDVVIPISVTPAIYWLWYAKKRKCAQGDGWVLNPPSNRPSEKMGHELITLMETYGGHGRAISELKQNGLKAKTLDQNRNKIKDALVNVLGENFIDHLGFESDKHADNTQSIYRLKISPNAISIS